LIWQAEFQNKALGENLPRQLFAKHLRNVLVKVENWEEFIDFTSLKEKNSPQLK